MTESPDRRYTQAEVDEILRNRLEEQAERLWAGRVDSRLDSIERRLDVRQRLLKVWAGVVSVVVPVVTTILERLSR
jgi:hypothetical protein